MFRAISLWFGVGRRRLCSSRELSPHIFSLVGGGSEWFAVVRSGADTPSLYKKKTLLPIALQKKNSTALRLNRGWFGLARGFSECCGLCRGTSEWSGASSARAESHSDNLPLQPRVVRAPLRSNREWFGAVRPVSGECRSGSGWFAVVRSGADTPSL